MEIAEEELARLLVLTQFEQEARQQGFQIIAGVDEAGRGPLAGPVVAAACLIPPDIYLPGIDDSKKLSPKVRADLFKRIQSDPRIIYGVGIISHEIIDRVNILQATIQAMLQAVENLSIGPDILLVDGLKLPHHSIHTQKIIRGDAKSQSIAAASVIAKETRDHLMQEYHHKWPQYGFDRHKGYGTASHLQALKEYGPCPIHRFTFAPMREKV